MEQDKAGIIEFEHKEKDQPQKPESTILSNIMDQKPIIPEINEKQINKPLDAKVKRIRRKNKITADTILTKGAEAISDRASERDTKAERSMTRCIKAFNAMFDKDLTETEGWQFMVFLKVSRGKQGKFRMDDYEDQASYSALAGESAQWVENET